MRVDTKKKGSYVWLRCRDNWGCGSSRFFYVEVYVAPGLTVTRAILTWERNRRKDWLDQTPDFKYRGTFIKRLRGLPPKAVLQERLEAQESKIEMARSEVLRLKALLKKAK